MDFNIPDAPEGETYDQELARVQRCIPAPLIPTWRGLLGGPDEREPGWPEFVAQMMQLTPERQFKTLLSIGALYLQRLGGQMLMIQNAADKAPEVTPLCLCLASEQAAPILASGYRMAKMTAVLASSELRGQPLMHPMVETLKVALEKSDEGSDLLCDLAEYSTDPEVSLRLGSLVTRAAQKALEMKQANAAVAKMLDGSAR